MRMYHVRVTRTPFCVDFTSWSVDFVPPAMMTLPGLAVAFALFIFAQ